MSEYPAFLKRGKAGQPEVGERHNANWRRITGTAHMTPGTEASVAHNAGHVPFQVVVEPPAVDRGDYLSADTAATGFDGTNVYFKSTDASVTVAIWVLA